MATVKNSKVNISLEKGIYEAIKNLSKKERTSISSIIRNLIKEALELREDLELSKFAEKRENSFDKSKALSHKEIWG